MKCIELNGKTILVTGSPGFIGANLVMRLLREMNSGTVVSLDNMNNYYDPALKEYCSAGYGFRIRHVIYAFANARIEVVRKTVPCSEDNPIVVLCVKNDIRRIQMLVEHYRSLGVVKFAFLDNGSEDGTFEWLLEQPDIDLYRCLERYQTNVKEGWINRIISHYGFDRWFIGKREPLASVRISNIRMT